MTSSSSSSRDRADQTEPLAVSLVDDLENAYANGATLTAYEMGLLFASARRVAPLLAALDQAEALLARIAAPATQYGARVYYLTDDFLRLAPYLTDEDAQRAGERPREASNRAEAERDAALARIAAVEKLCEPRTISERHYPERTGMRTVTIAEVLAALAAGVPGDQR